MAVEYKIQGISLFIYIVTAVQQLDNKGQMTIIHIFLKSFYEIYNMIPTNFLQDS